MSDKYSELRFDIAKALAVLHRKRMIKWCDVMKDEITKQHEQNVRDGLYDDEHE